MIDNQMSIGKKCYCHVLTSEELCYLVGYYLRDSKTSPGRHLSSQWLSPESPGPCWLKVCVILAALEQTLSHCTVFLCQFSITTLALRGVHITRCAGGRWWDKGGALGIRYGKKHLPYLQAEAQKEGEGFSTQCVFGYRDLSCRRWVFVYSCMQGDGGFQRQSCLLVPWYPSCRSSAMLMCGGKCCSWAWSPGCRKGDTSWDRKPPLYSQV